MGLIAAKNLAKETNNVMPDIQANTTDNTANMVIDLDDVTLDPSKLCEEFEKLHGRIYAHSELPQKEILDYAWRVILGEHYEELCEIRDEIVETLSNEYFDGVSYDMEQRYVRRRHFEKLGII